jgi:integrase/recombinase XerD
MAEISPLRRRMIEDMTVRNLSPATQQSYLNAVSKFGRYFGRSTPFRFIWLRQGSRGRR